MRTIIIIIFSVCFVACGNHIEVPSDITINTPGESPSPTPSPSSPVSPSPLPIVSPVPSVIITQQTSCFHNLPLNEGCTSISYSVTLYQDLHEAVTCLCNINGHQTSTAETYVPSDSNYDSALCPFNDGYNNFDIIQNSAWGVWKNSLIEEFSTTDCTVTK